MDVKAVSREDTFTHFEYLECVINFTRLRIIYRPPPSKKNQLRNSVFFDEWSHFLDSVVVDHRELIITGDLNFHLDNVQDPEGVKFLRILDDHGLVQHVKESTHSGGHILDVVILRDSSSVLYGEPCVTDSGLYDKNGNPAGDHLAICSKLTLSKPARERKSIKFRKLRDIVISDLSDSIRSSFELQKGENSVEKSVNLCNTTLQNILDSLAPVQSKVITIRPDCPWYTSELRAAKRERRKAERQMRRTDLTVHREIYRSHCTQVSKLAIHCKRSYYSSKIVEMGKDQKQLYRLTNRLMGAKSDVVLPAHQCEEMLANSFGEFFQTTIQKIRNELCNGSKIGFDPLQDDNEFTGVHLHTFEPASQDQIRAIILSASPKSCELDPMPSFLLKSCLDSCLAMVTDIINHSLNQSVVPSSFKQAVVRPLIKKTGLDPEEYRNYRPVSNLSFLSKILEKVVAKRLDHHLESNYLHDNVQSAYRPCHSTETALLRVHHDIVAALDSGSCVALIMLDLSAAFDVIDHSILINRLEIGFGISGSALAYT
ncbi:uncharacterized protein LOC134278448 [Saccostrea cucullata]|uniref:uncharacterized protein LOC134278448 n=1 Tax=Saccostrea cuccullata TaxID=36930 RepID=UPI002ED53C3C